MDLQWVEFVEQTLGRVEHINQTFEHMLERPPSVLSECASRTHFQQTNPMAEFKTLIAKYLVCPDKQLAIKFTHIYITVIDLTVGCSPLVFCSPPARR